MDDRHCSGYRTANPSWWVGRGVGGIEIGKDGFRQDQRAGCRNAEIRPPQAISLGANLDAHVNSGDRGTHRVVKSDGARVPVRGGPDEGDIGRTHPGGGEGSDDGLVVRIGICHVDGDSRNAACISRHGVPAPAAHSQEQGSNRRLAPSAKAWPASSHQLPVSRGPHEGAAANP